MADTLVAVGGALLGAAVLARVGRRVGLPTIPFFMVGRHPLGPYTPGPVVVEHPEDLELLASLGLVLLLFHLGLEFSLGDLAAGGRRLLAGGDLPGARTSAVARPWASPSAGAPRRRS